jgi:hypothetical protein
MKKLQIMMVGLVAVGVVQGAPGDAVKEFHEKQLAIGSLGTDLSKAAWDSQHAANQAEINKLQSKGSSDVAVAKQRILNEKMPTVFDKIVRDENNVFSDEKAILNRAAKKPSQENFEEAVGVINRLIAAADPYDKAFLGELSTAQASLQAIETDMNDAAASTNARTSDAVGAIEKKDAFEKSEFEQSSANREKNEPIHNDNIEFASHEGALKQSLINDPSIGDKPWGGETLDTISKFLTGKRFTTKGKFQDMNEALDVMVSKGSGKALSDDEINNITETVKASLLAHGKLAAKSRDGSVDKEWLDKTVTRRVNALKKKLNKKVLTDAEKAEALELNRRAHKVAAGAESAPTAEE